MPHWMAPHMGPRGKGMPGTAPPTGPPGAPPPSTAPSATATAAQRVADQHESQHASPAQRDDGTPSASSNTLRRAAAWAARRQPEHSDEAEAGAAPTEELAALAALPAAQKREKLGELVFERVARSGIDMARCGKVTGMLLNAHEPNALLALCVGRDDNAALLQYVHEAVELLDAARA